LIGAGVVVLIAVPIVIGVVRTTNLPGEEVASQGNTHIADVNTAHAPYNSNPATSGWHVGRLANWDSYDYTLPDELLLHNLEDGGVILWYRSGTPEENSERIARLEPIARGYPKTVIVPRDDLETTYTLTAWTRLQRFDDIDEEGMRAFLEAFEGIDHHAG